MKYSILFFASSLISLLAGAQIDTSLQNFEGLYTNDKGQRVILSPREGFPHIVHLRTGKTNMLRKVKDNVYEFSSTRNNFEHIGGFIELKTPDTLRILSNNSSPKVFYRKHLVREDLELKLKDSLYISGSLIRPGKNEGDKIAVLLHGDGPNDRYDLFDLAMYLIDSGNSVFIYDKRNAGKSYGKKVKGWYNEVSKAYADDAVQIVNYLQHNYTKNEIGVIGISQGGWIGAMVSGEVPSLSFYINIAGNISIGWQQWKHYMLSYLKRNGFNKDEVKEAQDYFTAFFDVGLGKLDFLNYLEELGDYENKNWLKTLEKRKLVRWDSQQMATEVISGNAFDPKEIMRKVSCPALGIFYEYDHSTPPDTPLRFLEGLKDSNSKDISLRIFPNSTHGGWTVNSYYFDSKEVVRQESAAFYHIINWLESI